jgi:membrane-associated phospholipid phosphatase
VTPETGPRPEAHAWGLVAVVAVGIVAITALLAATGVLPGEAVVRAIVRGASSADLRWLARRIRPLGTWWGILPGVVLLLALSRHARRRWWLWGLALVVAPLIGEALQELVGRLRPRGLALGFPSGHATAVAAFAVATIYLTGRSRLPHAVHLLIALVAAATALAVGMSRMVLDAHWPLDVVAGFALGAAGSAAAAWWDASHPVEPPSVPTRERRR